MKKLLLVLLSISYLATNAQIFINTNPNVNGNDKTVVKENKAVDETKKELQTTKTEVQEIETKITSPNYVNGTTEKTNVSGTTVSGTTSGTTISTGSNVGTTLNTTTTKTNTVTNVTGNTTSSYTNNSYKTTAAPAGGDVPPNAIPGKCYARCQTEDQYAFNTKQVVNTPKMVKRIQLPALYTTVYDTVIVRPKSVRYENVPAKYETITEQKMSAPATTKWIKGKADAGCLSANPDDCQVMCLVEVPAQYTRVSKRIITQEAYKREITIPMDYKIVAKQVKTQSERYAEQVIPATYKTVQERVLVKKGGYQGWREILCGTDLTSSKISAIQRALKAAGYNPGPIDNVFGTQTKEALKSYQRAKGLPVGNLNLETLRSLGVE